MKKIIVIIAAVIAFNAYSVTISTNLLKAICVVESNGKINAKGDYSRKLKEYRAIGAFQLWKIYVDDVNTILKNSGCKKRYKYSDRCDYRKSYEMVVIYLNHYGNVYEKRTGKKATPEILARIHNGGPKGYEKAKTIEYWHKVKNEMK
jgi:hypothetical protein